MSTSQHRHWVSRQVAGDGILSVESPILASVLIFGTPANLFLATIVLVRGAAITTDFLVAIVFGIAWLNIGGYLIWYYDEEVFPTFFESAREIFRNDEQLTEIEATYDEFFSAYHLLPVSVWVLLLVGLFFGSEQYLVANGLFTAGSPLRYLYLGAVCYLGFLSGIGFMGVITTTLTIRELTGLEFDVDPLHPDGLGGLSTIGYFAIRTTVTFSSGSMLLPLAFIFVRGNAPAWLIYFIVVAFTGAIAVSFVYPTMLINQKAQRRREEELDALRREYRQAKADATDYDDFQSADGESELVKRLELERIRREYQDYQNVRLYPFQIDIIFKLVSSVVLPVLFLVIDQYLI